MLTFEILYLILVLFAMSVTVWLCIFVVNSLFVDAPYVPVRSKTKQEIVKALKLSSGNVVYDLGCGDARVLLEANSSVKGIRMIGIEKNISVFLYAKWKVRNTPISIKYTDFNDISLEQATHIYMYLFPEIVEKIFLKIRKECSKGVRVVCCDFSLKDVIPDEVIELNAHKNQLCKRLYVYII